MCESCAGFKCERLKSPRFIIATNIVLLQFAWGKLLPLVESKSPLAPPLLNLGAHTLSESMGLDSIASLEITESSSLSMLAMSLKSVLSRSKPLLLRYPHSITSTLESSRARRIFVIWLCLNAHLLIYPPSRKVQSRSAIRIRQPYPHIRRAFGRGDSPTQIALLWTRALLLHNCP